MAAVEEGIVIVEIEVVVLTMNFRELLNYQKRLQRTKRDKENLKTIMFKKMMEI